jgi:hypothetical protein
MSVPQQSILSVTSTYNDDDDERRAMLHLTTFAFRSDMHGSTRITRSPVATSPTGAHRNALLRVIEEDALPEIDGSEASYLTRTMSTSIGSWNNTAFTEVRLA